MTQPGRSFDLRQRALPVALRRDPRDGSTPTVAAVVRHQAVAQHAVGDFLESRIDRGAHRQAAFVQHFLAVTRGDLAPDFLGEEGRVQHLDVAFAHLDGFGDPSRQFLGRDEPVLVHAPQHVVAPRPGRLGLARGVIVVGTLGQSGEISHFRQAEVVERFVEIVQRRRGHAIGPLAQEYFV